MARDYGITNAAPWASAPAVGAAGATYWNTTSKTLFISDGTAWVSAAVAAAGGDLSGTYPNPAIAAGAIVNADVNATAAIVGTKLADAPSGITTAKINDGAVTFVKRGDVAHALVTRASNQSMPAVTNTAVIFDTAVTNVGGIYSAGSPDRFTIQVAGLYLLGGSFYYAANATGAVRWLALALGAVATWQQAAVVPVTLGAPSLVVTTMRSLAAGNVLFLVAYHDATAAVAVNTAQFWIQRVA